CSLKGIHCQTSVYEAISDLEKSHGTKPSPDSKGFQAGVYGPVQSGYQKLMRENMDANKEIPDSHRLVNHRKETIELHEILLAQAPIGKRITPSDNIIPGL